MDFYQPSEIQKELTKVHPIAGRREWGHGVCALVPDLSAPPVACEACEYHPFNGYTRIPCHH